MMKKVIYLALALLLILALCACGGNDTTTAAPDPTGTQAPSGNANQNNTDDHTHDYRETVMTPATCTETGMMFLKCNTCGDSDYREIPATGHTEVIDAAVAPTCTETGLTEGKHCSVCRATLVRQEYIPLIEHDYNEQQLCAVCGNHQYLTFSSNDGESYYVWGTHGLTGVNDAIIIPQTYLGLPVTSIGSYAFWDCSNLGSITIPDSVTSIGDSAFRDCSSLTSVTIGNGVTSIGDSAFRDCSSLTSVTIGNGVTSIGHSAFRNCSSLTSITIPDSVTSIDDGAFWGCSSLNAVYISDLAAWCNIEFDRAENNPLSYAKNLYINGKLAMDITIPDGVASIGKYAFYRCSSLTSIEIPDSVTSIGDYAFHWCSSLTNITIPDSVTSIGSYAFWDCSNLASITIPDSVTSIGESAFWDCSSLTDIYYDGTHEQWKAIEEGTLWNSFTEKYTIHCTDGDYI